MTGDPRKTLVRVAAVLAVSVGVLCTSACANPGDDGPGRDGRDGLDARDDGGGADGSDAPDVEVPFPDGYDYSEDRVCDEQVFDIHHGIVRLMLLLDQSSSMMGSSWSQATSALEGLLVDPAFADMYFGLDAFPDGHPGSWASCGVLCFGCPADECGTAFPPQVAVEVNPVSAPAIIAHMNDPSYPQFCTFTPLVDQMEYYDSGAGETDAPEMYAADGDNYLVVISDGEDEGCFSGDPASALESHTRNILADHGLRSFAIGFGDTTGGLAAELNAIARNGGTSFTTFLHAEDGAALAAALESIASSVITCTYVLDDVAPTADPDQVNFYLDGAVVPMDADCTESTGAGWRWHDAGHTTVEFCGDYCASIRAGETGTISATFGCPTILL